MTPRVLVIIVTYNSARIVPLALESIRAQTYPPDAIQTVVVDNASADDTVAVVRCDFPWVTLLAERINHGFARGNNLAMRRYEADYYALINPDVVLRPDCLTALIDTMQSDPGIGVAGAKLFYGNRVVLQHAGGMLRDNALSYHLGESELDIGQYDHLRDVDYVTGAVLVARAEAVRQLGYLPDAYFMYFEETELCLRARRAGWRVVYVPSAVAYHDEQHSTGHSASQRYLWLYHRSRYLFALRNFTSADERARFCCAEREWKRQFVWGLRYRLILLAAKWSHWRLHVREPWMGGRARGK